MSTMTSATSSRLAARDLALIAAFAALIAALAQVSKMTPFGSGVPITLQSLGVMLAGAVLGWKRGALAVLTWLAVGAIGMPVFAGGVGGLASFSSPSAGYRVGFVFGAALIGWLVERQRPGYHPLWGFIANIFGGIGVVYLFGIPVTAMVTHTSNWLATAQSAAIFLPGDLIKALVAASVAAAVHRALPDLLVGSPRSRDHANV